MSRGEQEDTKRQFCIIGPKCPKCGEPARAAFIKAVIRVPILFLDEHNVSFQKPSRVELADDKAKKITLECGGGHHWDSWGQPPQDENE